MELFPKISIVIPSFNKVKFIQDALQSIIDQNYSNLEVIIQDGASADGTWEIVKKYAQKYPSMFKIESKKDKGQLDAINKGFKKASGEILTYINADDVYEKGAFDKVAGAYLKNPKSLWFAGRGKVIDENGLEIAKLVTFYKNICLHLNKNFTLLTFNYLMQPSVFLTRKAYEKFGPFTGTSKFVMEYDLWLKLGRVKMPRILPNILSSFRLSNDNITPLQYKKLLKEDMRIARKYTGSKLILGFHGLHNIVRKIIINI